MSKPVFSIELKVLPSRVRKAQTTCDSFLCLQNLCKAWYTVISGNICGMNESISQEKNKRQEDNNIGSWLREMSRQV